MTASKSRSQADWVLVEKDYRAGIRALRDIAADHSITEASIRKRSKRDGWTRDLTARIKAKVDANRSIKVEEIDTLDGAGYVYGVFIDAGGERFYKVGLAKQPDVRAAAHQTSLPFEARIGIAYFVPNMRHEERTLHVMFANKLVRGEWYKLDDSDLDAMAMRSRLE